MNIHKNIGEYNPNKKCKILIIFNEMIVDMLSNKKRELQQITFNHSSDTDFKDFINLYKKCIAEPYPFSVIDTNLD